MKIKREGKYLLVFYFTNTKRQFTKFMRIKIEQKQHLDFDFTDRSLFQENDTKPYESFTKMQHIIYKSFFRELYILTKINFN